MIPPIIPIKFQQKSIQQPIFPLHKILKNKRMINKIHILEDAWENIWIGKEEKKEKKIKFKRSVKDIGQKIFFNSEKTIILILLREKFPYDSFYNIPN